MLYSHLQDRSSNLGPLHCVVLLGFFRRLAETRRGALGHLILLCLDIRRPQSSSNYFGVSVQRHDVSNQGQRLTGVGKGEEDRGHRHHLENCSNCAETG